MSEELQDILEQYRAMTEQRDVLLHALELVEYSNEAGFLPIEVQVAVTDAIASATGGPPCAA